MSYFLKLFVILFVVASCSPPIQHINGIVPLPVQSEFGDGSLEWPADKNIGIIMDSSMFEGVAQLFKKQLESDYGMEVSVFLKDSQSRAADVVMQYDAALQAEGYQLKVDDKHVSITAQSGQGCFYALQSLLQILPRKSEWKGKVLSLPSITVNDFPKFPYRGAHLDVGRHFFHVDSVKRFIDMLALHKMNTFHWHLTEDQGWRIEIKKYPELTMVGAFRPSTVIGRNSSAYDTIPHGGYYTQEEVREVVRYAQDRYITVIPEIDMPGHMLAALAAYPELGCRDKKYEVARKWGVFDEVLCAGDEQTYRFVFDVLDEVMELFPSKYIHIGGDECPKAEWKQCSKCQNAIRKLGIKANEHHSAEEQLQSHFTSRVEKYLNVKGRLLIGWDEIMEGGLSPTATVMAWRSSQHAFNAAASGNQAILTPGSYCYFDHYQSESVDQEPLAIGGFTSVKRVYEYEPVPDSLPDSMRPLILGVQANVWTEYMKTFRQVEYMVLPRLAALSEVAWSSAPKNYDGFKKRLGDLVELYQECNFNYARHIFDVTAEITRDSVNHSLLVAFDAMPGADIRYTTNGTEPTLESAVYAQPIRVNKTMTLKAVAFYSQEASRVFTQDFQFNLATGKPLVLHTNPNPDYTYEGAVVLNDGILGAENYRSGRWLGYVGNDLSATIDLLKTNEVSSVALQCRVVTRDWIFAPSGIKVLVSENNQDFVEVHKLNVAPCDADADSIEPYVISFSPVKARYVRLEVESLKQIPAWHPGSGRVAYFFIDEVAVF